MTIYLMARLAIRFNPYWFIIKKISIITLDGKTPYHYIYGLNPSLKQAGPIS